MLEINIGISIIECIYMLVWLTDILFGILDLLMNIISNIARFLCKCFVLVTKSTSNVLESEGAGLGLYKIGWIIDLRFMMFVKVWSYSILDTFDMM